MHDQDLSLNHRDEKSENTQMAVTSGFVVSVGPIKELESQNYQFWAKLQYLKGNSTDFLHRHVFPGVGECYCVCENSVQ